MQASWVGYGRGAAESLRNLIAAAKGDDPLGPVTVVIPSNHVGVATRRLLASGDLGPVCGRGIGLIAVDFLTVYRLAELLGAPHLAGTGRRPVSTPVIAAAIRAALSKRPGVFEPVATHAATEEALVGAYRELRDLPDESLDALAGESVRAADVVRLHREVRAKLVTAWYDEEDLSGAARLALQADTPKPALGRVIVYLPQRLSHHMARLLEEVSGRHEVVVLAGAAGDRAADEEVVGSLTRIGLPPEFPVIDHGPYAAPRTRIVTTSDADEEVREAVRSVVAAARSGTRLDRMAILHASPEPYGRLVHEQLAAAGIKANGVAVLPLRERVFPRSLLQLLSLPQRGFLRPDVLAWMAGAPMIVGGRQVPVTAWDRLSRQAGVVKGRADWDGRLESLAARLDDSAAHADHDPDEPDWKAASNRRDAEHARSLRKLVLSLIDDLTAAASGPLAWSERAAWARGLLARLFGPPEHLPGAWALVPTLRPDQVRAVDRVQKALDRLGSLDAVEGPVELDTFTRTLSLEFDADLGRVGRLGDGILVGSVGLGLGLDLDLVVVLGLAEGSFPTLVREDSLLPDRERAVCGKDSLPLRRQSVGRQHRQLLAAVSGARQQILIVPRGDLRRSAGRMPSRWVLDAASVVAGRPVNARELLDADEGRLSHVASFAAGIRQLTFPPTDQEYRLAEILSGSSPVEDAVYRAGTDMIAARRSANFTRFDGNLGGLDVRSPTETVMSATRLEEWADCPMRYLLKCVLGIRELEDREDELRIDPAVKGKLVHDALERFVCEALERSGGEVERDRDRMRQIGERVCSAYEDRGLTGHPLFWLHDRRVILAGLDRFVVEDTIHHEATGRRPLAVEFGFADPPAVLKLPDGRSVSFRGRVDRIDVDEEGRLTVVDYKTGRADAFVNLEADPGGRGKRLQLVVYALAARLAAEAGGASSDPVGAEYWMVSDKGGWRRHGYPVTDEILDQVGATVGQMVEGIERGVFPSHPTGSASDLWIKCPYCNTDGLGEADLQRAWERKRSDPAMSPYTNLADPVDV